MRLARAGWQTAPENNITGVMAGWQGGAGECQAGISRADGWTICGLARLTRRDQICARAGLDSTLNDLDLMVRLRAQGGPDFAADLSGAFSVVLWHQDSAQIEACRDHFGILPFYYAPQGEKLSCASDLRAALHLSGLPLDPAPTRLADFIMGHEVDPALTCFARLHRLPAAHRMVWQPGADPQITRYWHLPAPPLRPANGAAAGFLEHLQRATKDCLPAQAGAMLSGGLDSSSLTGLAARARQDAGAPPLPTLSFVYDGKPYDESAFIAAANDAFATAPHLIPVTDPPDLDAMGPLIDEQMDLFLAFGLQKSRAIYAKARQLGLEALIDGHGGDEVVSHGFGRLTELAADRRAVALLREIRGVARLDKSPVWGPLLIYLARHGGWPDRHPLRRLLLRLARWLAPARPPPADMVQPLDLLAAPLRDGLDPQTRFAPQADPGGDPHLAEQRAQIATLGDPLIQHAFETLHRSATAAGILPLYPFYDRHLVEYCLSLPAEVKLRGGATRWILRDAMKGILPDLIRLRRDKARFNAEFDAAIRAFIRAHEDSVFDGLEDFIDRDAARALFRRVATDPGCDTAVMRLFWRLVVLQHWHTALTGWRALQARGELI